MFEIKYVFVNGIIRLWIFVIKKFSKGGMDVICIFLVYFYIGQKEVINIKLLKKDVFV